MLHNTLLYTVLLTLFLSASATAQDLKIVYDAENGSMAYFRGTEQINKPAIKKGGLILLEIKNYNNYLYDVDFVETHETFEVAQGSGLLGGIQTLNLESILNPIMPAPTVSESHGAYYEAPVANVMSGSNGLSAEELRIIELESAISNQISVLESLESQLEHQLFQVQKLKDQRELRSISLEEVQKIKYHPKIPPSRIKAYSESYFEKVLDVNNIQDVSLSYLLEKKSDKEELRALKTQSNKTTKNYHKGIAVLERLSTELSQLSASHSSIFNVLQKLESVHDTKELSKELKQKISSLQESAANDNIQDLINIYYEYEEISANTFSTSYRAQGAGDMVNLDVKMLLKDSLNASGAAAQIQLSTIKVPVYGGVKINASVGVNFGAFLQQPQSYFIRDSIIRSQDTDQFLPYATSFLHFYRQGRKSISVGGSLGIGIPISANASITSPNFFVGPSLFFGNGERLVLNFGFMGGKVPQLSQGYEVGDGFEVDAAFIPLESLYKVGAFVGLSFNIRG